MRWTRMSATITPRRNHEHETEDPEEVCEEVCEEERQARPRRDGVADRVQAGREGRAQGGVGGLRECRGESFHCGYTVSQMETRLDCAAERQGGRGQRAEGGTRRREVDRPSPMQQAAQSRAAFFVSVPQPRSRTHAHLPRAG